MLGCHCCFVLFCFVLFCFFFFPMLILFSLYSGHADPGAVAVALVFESFLN